MFLLLFDCILLIAWSSTHSLKKESFVKNTKVGTVDPVSVPQNDYLFIYLFIYFFIYLFIFHLFEAACVLFFGCVFIEIIFYEIVIHSQYFRGENPLLIIYKSQKTVPACIPVLHFVFYLKSSLFIFIFQFPYCKSECELLKSLFLLFIQCK